MYACIYIYIFKTRKKIQDWSIEWARKPIIEFCSMINWKKKQIAWCRMYKTYGSNSTNFIYLSFYLECSLKKVVNVIESIKLSPDFFFFSSTLVVCTRQSSFYSLYLYYYYFFSLFIYIYISIEFNGARAHMLVFVLSATSV